MREETPSSPVARQKPEALTIHGHTRIDPYYWLREKENEEVIAYLEAENAYTEAMMAHTEALQQKLYEEMVGRIQETDQTVPVEVDGYLYYSRTEEGKQYNIYCRKQGSQDAEEQVLLDLNELAEGHEYLRLGVYQVSPDHRLLAYSLDTDGSEDYVIYFKNLQNGKLLPDRIPDTSYSGEWGNDNQTFFFTTKDEAKRDDRVWRHRLGENPDRAEQVFHEPDELFRVYLYHTRDRRYIILGSESKETNEQHFLDAGEPAGDFYLIAPRQKDTRYYAGHHTGTFYIRTNSGEAPNFKVVTAPVETPGREHWQELIPHRQSVKIDDLDLFTGHLVLYERENGLRTIRVSGLESGTTHAIDFPEPVYTYRQERNPVFESKLLRFTYTSLTTPESVYDYHMDSRERILKKRKPVLGGYDPDDYQSERLFASADDGTEIPISLVYKKARFTGEQPAPCLLYGYGSYGISVDPAFDSNRLSLLDRGFIFAIAHVRGGQELGRSWYDRGKFLHKRNTFTDFIACARHLIAEGCTSPQKLAIRGGSAGGLLMGAVLNMAPHLFQAAVAAVPFVDVVTTMLDESIPLTVGEFEEWGNPKDPEYYEYMLAYSPYDNVSAQEYPHLLITAGLNDPRVQYWEPAKWTARLRDAKVGTNRLLLKTEMGAGHAGPSGRYDYLKEIALQYTFVLDALGVT